MAQIELKGKLDSRLDTPDIGLLKFSPKIFEPHRMLILSSIYLHGLAEFRQLKYGLGLTDGNLFSHLRALEQADYIRVNKEIVDRKLRTTYELTVSGKAEFEKLLSVMMTIAHRLELDDTQGPVVS